MSLPDPPPTPWLVAREPAAPADWPIPDLQSGRALSAGSDGRESLAPDATGEELAYERGHAAGMSDGYARAEQYAAPAREALVALVTALEAAQQSFARDWERNLHALAIAIAERLFEREIAVDPSLLRDLIRRASDLLPSEVSFDIRLNPDDLHALGEHLELYADDGRALPVHWIADHALDRGSFILDSPQRIIDGRADVALRNLYERLGHD